jgi:hypothetical protein
MEAAMTVAITRSDPTHSPPDANVLDLSAAYASGFGSENPVANK